jgi:hypothetical protein
MKTLAATLGSALGLVAALGLASAQPATATAEDWRQNYAYTLGVQAYIFGFPYVNLPMIRWAWVTQEPGPGPNHDQTPYAAINHFFHFRTLTDATYRGGGGPNNDTLYSIAWIDVSKEPVILSHPGLADRFFIFQLAGMDGDNFAAVGTRATGSKAGNFAIVGPGWKGTLPAGVQALPRAQGNTVFMIGRTLVNGPSDVAAVNRLQDRYVLTPLSYWGQKNAAPPANHVAWRPFDAKADPLADWKTMNKAMADDPPSARYASLMTLFSKVGIGPGLNIDSLDDATKRGLARAATDGRALITSINKGPNPSMGKKINGWGVPPLTYGRLGMLDDYLMRAVICQAGMLAPWIEDNWTAVTTTDSNDVLLDGAKRYVIRFAPGELPKVKGFWSLTLYDNSDNLNPNPINRYSIGNRTEGLKPDADSGLSIYIQHESPGNDKASNWLPSPESGKMRVAFRAYWPDEAVQKGLWNPPGIVEVR